MSIDIISSSEVLINSLKPADIVMGMWNNVCLDLPVAILFSEAVNVRLQFGPSFGTAKEEIFRGPIHKLK